jgi:hypothetical protein
LAGAAVFAQSTGYPLFSTKVPTGGFAPTGNFSSADLGEILTGQGGRAIDLTP